MSKHFVAVATFLSCTLLHIHTPINKQCDEALIQNINIQTINMSVFLIF